MMNLGPEFAGSWATMDSRERSLPSNREREMSSQSEKHMWPVWVFALFTQSKSFKSNPVIGAPWLNKLGLHVARVVTARLSTRLRQAMLRHKIPADSRAAFHRDGFCVIPDFVDAATLAVIKSELASYTGPARQMVQGDTITQRLLLDRGALAGRPALSSLVNDGVFLGLLAYCGAKATRPLFYIQRILNGVANGKVDPQKTMHADTFHPTVKAWLFLEDVEQKDGPFTYVCGSQRLTWARLVWEYRRSIVAAQRSDGYTE